MNIKKFAKNYLQFQNELLKKKYDGKVKSPFQLDKEEMKKFFKTVKEEWKKEKDK